MPHHRLDKRMRPVRRDPVSRWVPFAVLALLLHGAGGAALESFLPYFAPEDRPYRPLSLVILDPLEDDAAEEPEDPERIQPKGQLVDLPPPLEEQTPDEAEYVAEHDITVEEETKSDLYEVNPEVLAPEYSEESKMEQEDLLDLGIEEPSTGATTGEAAFAEDPRGTAAAVSSPWKITNQEGLQNPVPAAHRAQDISGAPNNDLLDELSGERTALNAKEYLYAGYLNRIRRLVNFYWEQNVDNLPASVRLVRSAYTTRVEAVLDADGALELVEVTDSSTSEALDGCVTRAFRLAGPFPNPPEGLIEKDGRVYLPPMSFTVRLGQARMQYQGVDPRAGVQFPGILKSPR